MNRESSRQVALLVDFENLIKNSSDAYHAKLLVDFAKEYGRVVISKAYANWNYTYLRKHERACYDYGIDPVKILRKNSENIVDIKLAVDAVDMMHFLSQINVFIIVSSDKDFTHLYEILRAHGKMVVVVAFNSNPILERSCDRFILYESIIGEKKASVAKTPDSSEDRCSQHIHQGAQDADLTPVKQALKKIIEEYPNGILATRMKQLLLENFSPRFDEKNYGFNKFRQLLNALDDVVETKNSEGNILVYSAGSTDKSPDISTTTFSGDSSAEVLLASDASEHSNILVQRLQRGPRQHFTQNTNERHNILKIIFAAIEQQQPFSLEDIFERVANMKTEDPPNRAVIRYYLRIISEGSGFTEENSQNTLKMADRMMSLREDINSEYTFIFCYEQSVVLSLRGLVGDEQELSASLLAEILGFPPENEKKQAYCQSLFNDLTSADIASADGIASESTAPGTTAAEDVSAEEASPETTSYTTEDK